ncbi:YHYH protein [Roseibium sp. RKSG952]|uniref:YHYH protein n=1 Tax=Roseibium sp. RKSG952 TaxID=2529384 RepID=UPI0012BC7591|nr:YHYH protein [Roseibium sp. RKSG952]MTH98301.1 YHYH protein [Roseibium sp. RKSG952]
MSRFVKRFAGLALLAGIIAGFEPVEAHDFGPLTIPPNASPALQSFLAHVSPDAIMQDTEEVECTLSGGTRTQCVKLVLKQSPSYEPGPWCPETVDSGSEDAGIWIKDGKVYSADGAFIKNLATFYDDPNWRMYDPQTGDVLVTKSFDACFGAARPDVWAEYYYYCAQCETDQTVTSPLKTFFIPLNPVKAESPAPLRDQPGAGVSLNGVRFEGPAPIQAILKAYNIAPFDDCGGHVNPYEGYHYHFVTSCVENIGQPSGHAAQVGIAMDGYGLYERLNVDRQPPVDLDDCGGHSSVELGYHYHAAPVGVNGIIGCVTGEQGCASSPGSQNCDATQVRRPPPPPSP